MSPLPRISLSVIAPENKEINNVVDDRTEGKKLPWASVSPRNNTSSQREAYSNDLVHNILPINHNHSVA
jgi:hypothetical protein